MLDEFRQLTHLNNMHITAIVCQCQGIAGRIYCLHPNTETISSPYTLIQANFLSAGGCHQTYSMGQTEDTFPLSIEIHGSSPRELQYTSQQTFKITFQNKQWLDSMANVKIAKALQNEHVFL